MTVPVHQCLSLVDHDAIPAWLAQCVEDQEWEDPFVAEDLPEYLPCCFERDFGVILDEVTLTDEVDLIQACEHWGQRVDKQLRAERPQVDHGQARHNGPPEPSQAPAGARPRHTTTPLFDEWQDPIDRVRQLQAEDEKQSARPQMWLSGTEAYLLRPPPFQWTCSTWRSGLVGGEGHTAPALCGGDDCL